MLVLYVPPLSNNIKRKKRISSEKTNALEKIIKNYKREQEEENGPGFGWMEMLRL